jgi:hypothetical protein
MLLDVVRAGLRPGSYVAYVGVSKVAYRETDPCYTSPNHHTDLYSHRYF